MAKDNSPPFDCTAPKLAWMTRFPTHRNGLPKLKFFGTRLTIRLKPDFAFAHDSLGIVLFDQGHADEAIGQFQEVIRLKPDDADAQSH